MICPVLGADPLSRSSTDSFEHVLSRVGIRRAVSAVFCEVFSKNVRILSDISKVDLQVLREFLHTVTEE